MSLGRSLGMKGLNGSLVMFSAVSGVSVSISSVQFSSVAQSCPTLCNPMNCNTPVFIPGLTEGGRPHSQ